MCIDHRSLVLKSACRNQLKTNFKPCHLNRMAAEGAGSSVETDTENPRLGKCEVCATKRALYTCPKCEVKTCSLKCNKIHKLEVECDGQRDKAKFIPVNKFTNLDLSSDYRLLEEISRVVEVSKKGRGHFNKFYLPPRCWKLKEEAVRRRMFLKFLPPTFVRHKKNMTRFNHKSQLIEWHVDLVFVNAENVTFSEKVPEVTKLSSVLHKFFVKQEDDYLQDKLQFYQAADLPGIKLFLKAEQKGAKRFYEVDPLISLKDCLRGKIIIEYPVFHVVLKGHSGYNVIDSDDEENSNLDMKNLTKSGKYVVDSIIKKSESDDSVYDSLKNLLFTSDCADEEEDDN